MKRAVLAHHYEELSASRDITMGSCPPLQKANHIKLSFSLRIAILAKHGNLTFRRCACCYHSYFIKPNSIFLRWGSMLASCSRLQYEEQLRGLSPERGLVAAEQVKGAVAKAADLQEAICK